MVRKNRPNAQLAAWWAGLDVHAQRRVLFGLKQALAPLNADRDGEYQLPPSKFNPDTPSAPRPQPGSGDEPHPPTMSTHDHRHFHGVSSGEPNLDSEGFHSHGHHHGSTATGQAVPDNDHEDHDHDAVTWPPGEAPGSGERPETGARYRQRARLQPGRVYNRAAVDAAFARLARTAARIQRGSR